MSFTNLYAIYDIKGEFYGSPFCALNDGLALRLFHSLLLQPNQNYSLYPEDFCLYFIGSFDTSSAAFESCTPRLVITAESALRHLRAMREQTLPDCSDPVSETVDN